MDLRMMHSILRSLLRDIPSYIAPAPEPETDVGAEPQVDVNAEKYATLSLVPRMIAILVTLAICAPWLLGQLLEFAQRMFGSLPSHLVGP